MQAWFVAMCKPNQEARAAVELTNQEFEVYLPALDSKPMCPRYIFVKFDRESDNWGTIRSTRGCIDLLRNGFMPSPVPESAMKAIMSYQAPQEPIPTDAQFTPGQTVKIVEGVLAGLEGLFQRDAKGRSMALLEIMGRKVEIPKDSIRAA
jgi:transcriptional antiterminator RfaH